MAVMPAGAGIHAVRDGVRMPAIISPCPDAKMYGADGVHFYVHVVCVGAGTGRQKRFQATVQVNISAETGFHGANGLFPGAQKPVQTVFVVKKICPSLRRVIALCRCPRIQRNGCEHCARQQRVRVDYLSRNVRQFAFQAQQSVFSHGFFILSNLFYVSI